MGWRSLRIEYSYCRSTVRSSLSGAMEGRPVLGYQGANWADNSRSAVVGHLPDWPQGVVGRDIVAAFAHLHLLRVACEPDRFRLSLRHCYRLSQWQMATVQGCCRYRGSLGGEPCHDDVTMGGLRGLTLLARSRASPPPCPPGA